MFQSFCPLHKYFHSSMMLFQSPLVQSLIAHLSVHLSSFQSSFYNADESLWQRSTDSLYSIYRYRLPTTATPNFRRVNYRQRNVAEFFIPCLSRNVSMPFLPWETRAAFLRGKPAATESCYPTYGACWVFQCFHDPPNCRHGLREI